MRKIRNKTEKYETVKRREDLRRKERSRKKRKIIKKEKRLSPYTLRPKFSTNISSGKKGKEIKLSL